MTVILHLLMATHPYRTPHPRNFGGWSFLRKIWASWQVVIVIHAVEGWSGKSENFCPPLVPLGDFRL